MNGNMYFKDGQMFTPTNPLFNSIQGLTGGNAFGALTQNPKLMQGNMQSFGNMPPLLSNITSQVSGGQQQPAQSNVPRQTKADLQAQFNRLASQASNALNGGLLGYQPSEIRAAGSNPQTFTGPTGAFRFPFGLLNGTQGGM